MHPENQTGQGSGAEAASAGLGWTEGGAPVSRRFDDPYFSLGDGLAETRHVFLAGNGLPERLQPGFHVAELGFGTGLNMIALCLAAAGTAAGPLRFTSFEAFPLTAAEIARALAAFPEARDAAGPFLDAWAAGARRFRLDAPGGATLEAEVIEGDAGVTLPRWKGRADAWFLDGFAPAKNPGLWSPALMAEVRRHTAPGGTFATYTAAGAVRRALAETGFAVERRSGYGRKRHMSCGRLAGPPDDKRQGAQDGPPCHSVKDATAAGTATTGTGMSQTAAAFIALTETTRTRS